MWSMHRITDQDNFMYNHLKYKIYNVLSLFQTFTGPENWFEMKRDKYNRLLHRDRGFFSKQIDIRDRISLLYCLV